MSAAVLDIHELDTRIHPCDDLNAFVNRKWLDANPIPEDKSSWGAFEALREQSLEQQHQLVKQAAQQASSEAQSSADKLGLLYAAGMDTSQLDKLGYSPINPLLDKIDHIEHRQHIIDFISERYQKGDSYVFAFGASADFNDASKQIAYVFQAGLSLPTRDYYLNDNYADVREAYLSHIEKSLELIDIPRADAQRQAKQVLALETNLAKASLTPVELRNTNNQYHFVSFDEARDISPVFDWKAFFVAQQADVSTGFSMSQPGFIRRFNELLQSCPIEQWQAYLRFHMLDGSAPYLNRALRDNHFAFYGKTLTGQPQQEPRWKQVVGSVNAAMGMALGEMYVAKYFPPQSKQRAEQLVTAVLDALKQHILELDWMSRTTKEKAMHKWQSFIAKIGYPDEGKWRQWKGLNVTEGQWFNSLAAARAYNYRYDIDKIGRASDRQEWHMSPQTVNAYYDPSTNTINFPAAILQAPFFYPDADDAINFGGIGAVIGHEATHGFDDQGSQFDGQGNRINWWSQEDKRRFDALTHSLVEQFNAYHPIASKPELSVNGELTLGENIADLGGLSIAHTALANLLDKARDKNQSINGYTPQQRFFINWARVWRYNIRQQAAEMRLNMDPHAPASIRAIAAPSNLPAFFQAFDCQHGNMKREKIVKIW